MLHVTWLITVLLFGRSFLLAAEEKHPRIAAVEAEIAETRTLLETA